MKSFVKVFIAVLVLTSIMETFGKTAYANEFKQSSLDGVVLVVSVLQDEEGEVYYSTGTGFFVGIEEEDPQYILTNCHVIEDFLINGGSAGSGILQIAYDKESYEEAYVVTYDAEKDIALLKLAKPTKERSALMLKTVDESYVGSSVFAIGYPYTADQTIEAVNYYGKNDATVTGGRISRFVTESGSGRQLLQMDVSINYGNSGGPLVDENGFVVGINTLGSTLDANLNYAVSIEEAIPILKNNNIPYEVGDVGNINWYLILVIGGAVTLLLIIIIVIVMLNKGKKKEVQNPINPMTPAEQPLIKKAVPVLHSMSSQHLGLTTGLSSQPILIGRDTKLCRLVYKEDTPGVSSRHCQIYFDESNKIFILTDTNSTYGTYLSNGQKLAPNVPYPLRPKDSFYLGEKENLIYVDLE